MQCTRDRLLAGTSRSAQQQRIIQRSIGLDALPQRAHGNAVTEQHRLVFAIGGIGQLTSHRKFMRQASISFFNLRRPFLHSRF